MLVSCLQYYLVKNLFLCLHELNADEKYENTYFSDSYQYQMTVLCKEQEQICCRIVTLLFVMFCDSM